MPDTHVAVARTPLHHWHAARGARFADQDGWQVVAAYSSAEPKAAGARAGLGLADVSAGAKLSLRGPAVSSLVASLVPESAALRPRGVAGVRDEKALLCRLTEDHLLVLASTAILSPRLARLGEGQAVVRTDVTSAYASFELIAPQLEVILSWLTDLDVTHEVLPANSCAETGLAGVEAVLVRSGQRSLPAMRILVAWDVGEYIWERILNAGGEVPVVPVGLEALALVS
jgi:glycine cleavage system aminomethyltransferase T